MDNSSSNASVANQMKSFEQYLVDTAQQSASSKDVSGFLLDTSATLLLPNIQKIPKAEHERQLRTKQAELLSTRTEVVNLKRKLCGLEQSNKRVKIEQDQEHENMKQQLQKSFGKMEEMRTEKLKGMRKLEVLHDKLDGYQKKMTDTKVLYQKKVAVLQKEKNQVSEERKELSLATQSQLFDLKKENRSLESELSRCQSEIMESKEQLQSAIRRATGSTQAAQELEKIQLHKQQSDQRVKELEEDLSRMKEDAMIVKTRKEELSRMPTVERENRRLKEENQYYKDTTENVLLLKEEVTGLQRKLQRYEKRLSELPTLELENEEMKKLILQWEACFKAVGVNKQSPEKLSRMIAELQGGQLLMLEKHGHLQTSSQILEQGVHRLEQQEKATKQQLNQHKEKSAGQADFIKRIQRKLLLITKERDAFREIIQTYENEVTLSITAPLSSQRKQPSMKELDSMVLGYQRQVSQIEAELENATSQMVHYKSRVQQLEDQISMNERHSQNIPSVTSVAQADQKIIMNLREKVAQLEKSAAKLEEEKEILEARIEQRNIQGDYDPTKTKVLHCTMNPIAEAKKNRSQELKQLQEDNEKLRKRISLLEEAGRDVEDLTTKVDLKMEEYTTPSKELEAVKAQLNSAELKNKRLVEAFKQTSRELREGCFQLTGYRIDMPVPKQYKLMNIYAESAEDYLKFQRGSNGELNLLETEYSRSLSDLIEMYLGQANSIPAFLSALTMELFKKQTILM